VRAQSKYLILFVLFVYSKRIGKKITILLLLLFLLNAFPKHAYTQEDIDQSNQIFLLYDALDSLDELISGVGSTDDVLWKMELSLEKSEKHDALSLSEDFVDDCYKIKSRMENLTELLDGIEVPELLLARAHASVEYSIELTEISEQLFFLIYETAIEDAITWTIIGQDTNAVLAASLEDLRGLILEVISDKEATLPSSPPSTPEEKSLQEKIDDLVKDFKQLESILGELDERIGSLKEIISGLESEISSLVERIDSLESRDQGIPGFPLESIIIGLIAGSIVIWMIQRE
jgi:hypothetical protein